MRWIPRAGRYVVLDGLVEQHLDTRLHDVKGFDCGIPELNRYLQHFASQHQKTGISQTYVLADTKEPQVVLGYYAVSAAQIDVNQVSEGDRKRLPRYPLPCFRVGRLAADQRYHGNGLGKILIGCAVDRCLAAREQVGAFALIVDAKDETAKAFYEHFGFTAFTDQPRSLYLPLGK